ncbi:MAG: amidase [Gemmatimonas sp.]
MNPPTAPSILERDPYGAFTRHTHVSLEGSGHGALAGLTFGLKDIYHVAGYRTGFGNPDWLRTHGPAHSTASVVTKLLDAGATLVGRTHTEEMAFSLTGENAHYGTPVNPRAPDRVPGGSSSGSASAGAGGLVDFAIGSDTGGSVRGPASFCGIYGIRPTHGRIALDHVLPLAPSYDTCGWFANTANVLSRVGRVLFGGPAGVNAPARGPLLVASDAFAYAMPGVADALAPAVSRVASLLGDPRDMVVSREGISDWYDVFRVVQYDDIWRAHGEWITRVQPTLGPQMKMRFEAVAANDVSRVDAMKARRAAIADRLHAMLSNNAVMLLPSISDVAPQLNASPQDTVTFRERALGLLCIAGLGGLPQISLPYATIHGLPVGLSMIAARGNDEMLLDIAVELERSMSPRL